MTVTLEPSVSTQLALSACCTVSAILGLRSRSETCLQHHSISITASASQHQHHSISITV